MPELPEVEILRRHLEPVLTGRRIQAVEVRRQRVVRPSSEAELSRVLVGARFQSVDRRGKYLVFGLRRDRRPVRLIGHLGMTGRLFVQPVTAEQPNHAAVILGLDGRQRLVFQDTRYFGRMNLDTAPLDALGPEPLGPDFSRSAFATELRKSVRAVKLLLLDQSVVAGVGNIYASEALHRAGISPRRRGRDLTRDEVGRLRRAIRTVLGQAVRGGSTIPLDFANGRDGLFYYGAVEAESGYHQERLRVYDRCGEPCVRCRSPIERIVQGARSTFFCPVCQG